MEFGDDIIRRCPDCNVIFAQHTYLSASTHGLIQWTDGYWTSDYLNVPPVIVYCPFCRQWMPVSDTEELFTLPIDVDYGLIPVIELDDGCTSDDYLEALNSPRCSHMEKELRMRLWWRLNDKRRYHSSDSDDQKVTEDFHINLNKLITLLGQDEETLIAEVLRELGKFDEVVKILAQEDSEGNPLSESESGRTIIINCEKKNILPVEIGVSPSPVIETGGSDETLTAPVCEITGDDSMQSLSKDVSCSPEFDIKKVLEQGFYPFPYPEDIFAFPTQAKDSEDVFLAVDLSKIKKDWSGWAPFFPKEAEHRFMYGRLFNTDEWRQFRRCPHEWQNELMEFWGYSSGTVTGEPGYINKYFRIRYQLFHGYSEYIDHETITEKKDLFDPFWQDLKEKLMEEDEAIFLWMIANEAQCYWDLFWREYNEDFPVPAQEDIRMIQHEILEREERSQTARIEALDGLQYVELGGFPHWFQGCDKTPASLSGKRMDFVAQVWTDCVSSYSSVLVYLFYDHENGLLAQVYDYD